MLFQREAEYATRILLRVDSESAISKIMYFLRPGIPFAVAPRHENDGRFL